MLNLGPFKMKLHPFHCFSFLSSTISGNGGSVRMSNWFLMFLTAKMSKSQDVEGKQTALEHLNGQYLSLCFLSCPND